MEFFSNMADQWIAKNVSPIFPVADAKEAKEAKKGSAAMQHHDAAAWVDDFQVWSATECAYRDRVIWSIGNLHVRFCEWCVKTESVPCRRDVFEQLLTAEDFLTTEGFCYGLLPRACLADLAYLTD